MGKGRGEGAVYVDRSSVVREGLETNNLLIGGLTWFLCTIPIVLFLAPILISSLCHCVYYHALSLMLSLLVLVLL